MTWLRSTAMTARSTRIPYTPSIWKTDESYAINCPSPSRAEISSEPTTPSSE